VLKTRNAFVVNNRVKSNLSKNEANKKKKAAPKNSAAEPPKKSTGVEVFRDKK